MMESPLHGFDNLDAYMSATTAKITKDLNDEREKLILLSATSQLMSAEVVVVEPVPFVWMSTKAHEIYGQSRGMVRTEEELFNHFKGQTLMNGTTVDNKQTLLAFFAEKVAQQLVHDLVLRSWGKKKGISGESSLETLPEYVAGVKKTILDNVKIEEYEVELPKEI